VTIENPLVVFALTAEVIEPAVLETAVALDALQFHATYVPALSLPPASYPTVKPLESNAVTPE